MSENSSRTHPKTALRRSRGVRRRKEIPKQPLFIQEWALGGGFKKNTGRAEEPMDESLGSGYSVPKRWHKVTNPNYCGVDFGRGGRSLDIVQVPMGVHINLNSDLRDDLRESEFENFIRFKGEITKSKMQHWTDLEWSMLDSCCYFCFDEGSLTAKLDEGGAFKRKSLVVKLRIRNLPAWENWSQKSSEEFVQVD